MERLLLAFALALGAHLLALKMPFRTVPERPPELSSSKSVAVSLVHAAKTSEKNLDRDSAAAEHDSHSDYHPAKQKPLVEPSSPPRELEQMPALPKQAPPLEPVAEKIVPRKRKIVFTQPPGKPVRQSAAKEEAVATKAMDIQTPESAAPQRAATKNISPPASPGSLPAVEARPLYRYNPKPEYPLIARKRGWEGVVLLEVRVAATGQVAKVQVHKSSGYKMLDLSAVKSVRLWKFLPGKSNGEAVASTILIPVHFTLQ